MEWVILLAAGGKVLTVLFSALIGGMALGQGAPNIKYFQQGRVAGARVLAMINRWLDLLACTGGCLVLMQGFCADAVPSTGHPAPSRFPTDVGTALWSSDAFPYCLIQKLGAWHIFAAACSLIHFGAGPVK